MSRHGLTNMKSLFYTLILIIALCMLAGCITLNIGTSQTPKNSEDKVFTQLSETDSLWLAQGRRDLEKIRGLARDSR